MNRPSGGIFFIGNSHIWKMWIRAILTCLHSRRNYASAENVPSILLEGIWLKESGFNPVDYAEIECNDGQLIIRRRERGEETVDPAVAAVQKAYNNLSKSQKRKLERAIAN